ncbi:MAG: hypothetical protein ABEI07_00435, partial [Candidatus Nanohaloarchaea archaeon]
CSPMPKYVCDECGEVFDSKEELAGHTHEESGFNLSLDFLARARNFTWKQVLAVIGVVLMSTLFMGSAFFYSSLAPSTGSSGNNLPETRAKPPVGYTIGSVSDVPNVPRSRMPDRAVVEEQLSGDVQLNLLTGYYGNPAALLQYSCNDCPGTVSKLVDVANSFNSGTTWVYVAPYRDMDARISATAFRKSVKLEEFNRTELENFICNGLNQRPLKCGLEG